MTKYMAFLRELGKLLVLLLGLSIGIVVLVFALFGFLLLLC